MRHAYRVEIANKIGKIRGELTAVGTLYGVARYIDGCRNAYVMRPQNDCHAAHEFAALLNGTDVDPLACLCDACAKVARANGADV